MTINLEDDFLLHLNNDISCLHMTDGLPGLTFNPLKQKGLHQILSFKKRLEKNPFISLCADQRVAETYFIPFPYPWQKVLLKLWPGPLSIIWRASNLAPLSLIKDNNICIRVPKLKDNLLLKNILQKIDFPLPSTSVNTSGMPPCKTWKEAVMLLNDYKDFYVPPIKYKDPLLAKPSTIIKLFKDGSYKLIRKGGLSEEKIIKALNEKG